MLTVIYGADKVAFLTAKALLAEGRRVVLIEPDEERAARVDQELDCLVVAGDAIHPETLAAAGMAEAGVFISLSESDEKNLIACALVSSLYPVKRKIARVQRLENESYAALKNSGLGIDQIINPSRETARAIIMSLEGGAVSDVLTFNNSELQIRSFTITPASPFLGHSLGSLKKLFPQDFLVAQIQRRDEFFVPVGKTEVALNDTLYLAGREAVLKDVFEKLGMEAGALRRVVVVGGGSIGRDVLMALMKQDERAESWTQQIFQQLKGIFSWRQVTVIERDRHKCEALARDYEDVMVIHADISEEGAFEEDFSETDLLICTTDNQELNVMTAVYAKTLGVERTIALVNKPHYLPIARNLGVDVTVSLRDSMVQGILRYLRSDNIRSAHSLPGGRVEVLEIKIPENCPGAKRPLANLKLPPQTLVLSVTQHGDEYVPDGRCVLQPGDQAILISAKESIPEIERLFGSGI